MNAVERLWNALVVTLWTLATLGVAVQDVYEFNIKQLYTCYLIGPSCKILRYKNCTYTTNKLGDSNFYYSEEDFESPNGANLLHLNKHLSLCRDTNSSFTCAYGKKKSELELFCMKRTFPPFIDEAWPTTPKWSWPWENKEPQISSTENPDYGDYSNPETDGGGDYGDPDPDNGEDYGDPETDYGGGLYPTNPGTKPKPSKRPHNKPSLGNGGGLFPTDPNIKPKPSKYPHINPRPGNGGGFYPIGPDTKPKPSKYPQINPRPGNGGGLYPTDPDTKPKPPKYPQINPRPGNGGGLYPTDPEGNPNQTPPGPQPSPPFVPANNCRPCLPGIGDPADREIWVGTFVRYKPGMNLDLQQQCQPNFNFYTPT